METIGQFDDNTQPNERIEAVSTPALGTDLADTAQDPVARLQREHPEIADPYSAVEDE